MTKFKPGILNMLPHGNFIGFRKTRENVHFGKKKSWVPNELIQQMSTIKMPCKTK